MVLISMPVARFAIKFGPAEYFQLYVFALAATASITKGDRIRGFISMTLGLMIATIGIDAQSGVKRFTFGVLELQSGIDFLVVIIAIFALGEVFRSMRDMGEGRAKVQTRFRRIWISREEWRRSRWAIIRQAPLGFLVGALPGAGGTMAALIAYNNEKQLSKRPEEFGRGAIEGLAAPESANNAASVGALIPMLALGIPGSGTTAVMMGALLMLGLQPGPRLFVEQAPVVWGLIASMFIGNIILAILNIPLAGILVRVLAVPARILYPIILGLAFVGTYAISFSVVDFYLLVIFGLAGYLLSAARIPAAPLILAVIVGREMEQSFRRALKTSNGDPGAFFHSPIAIALFALTAISILYPLLRRR